MKKFLRILLLLKIFFLILLSIRYVFWPYEAKDIVAEPANRATAIIAPESLAGDVTNNYRSGFASLYLLEENIFTVPSGINFPLFSPLFEAFDQKVHQLLDTGLFSYWYRNLLNSKGFSRSKVEEIGPQVLTMEQLAVGFLICLCPLILSGLVFFGELIYFRIRKIQRN